MPNSKRDDNRISISRSIRTWQNMEDPTSFHRCFNQCDRVSRSIVGAIVRENCSGVGTHHPGWEGCKFSDLVALENRARPNSSEFDSIEPAFSLSLSLSLSLYLASLDFLSLIRFYEVEERFNVVRFPDGDGKWLSIYRAKYHCFTG